MTDILNTKLDLELLRIVDLKDILLNYSYNKKNKKADLVQTILDLLQSGDEVLNTEQKANLCQKINSYTQPKSTKYIGKTYPAGPAIYANIQLKSLLFFDNLCTLLNPTPILTGVVSKLSAQNSVFSIKLTSQQLSDLTNNKSDTTVQLRFCLKDITCEQNDNFPSNLKLKVNGKMCALPNPLPMKAGQPQRYLPGPINITDHLKSSASVLNLICCDWNTEFNRVYVVSCYMMRKVASSYLLEKLKLKGVQNKDYTTKLIKDKMNDTDGEISTTSLRVSLLCPLGKMRMTTPCRATTCLHLQCFDAALFLEMNELKQTFICPVCDKEALYENLVIDEYFQEVLASCSISDDNHEIELKNDGSWNKFSNKNVFFNLDLTPEVGIRPTKFKVSSESPEDKASALIDLTGVTPVKHKTSMKRINTMPNKTNATVDLTFSDSDDDSKIAIKRKKRSE